MNFESVMKIYLMMIIINGKSFVLIQEEPRKIFYNFIIIKLMEIYYVIMLSKTNGNYHYIKYSIIIFIVC